MADTRIAVDSFDWYKVPPKEQFYDSIERRFFINGLSHPIKIGFGHNPRRLEMIAIVESDGEDPAIAALEGEEITEE